MSNPFLEIEHKFLVAPDFDVDAFARAVQALSPRSQAAVTVAEEYFVSQSRPDLIFRHGYDLLDGAGDTPAPQGKQSLIVKSRPAPGASNESRLEVALRLDPRRGSQAQAAGALLGLFAFATAGRLRKQLRAFYFPDCEVVFYRAQRTDEAATQTGGPTRSICCVEFEAVLPPGPDASPDTVDAARSVLARYEQQLGFAHHPREGRTLFQLLFGDGSI